MIKERTDLPGDKMELVDRHHRYRNKAQGEKGDDGVSPHIGNNGNWWIGTTDTRIKAQGEKGVNGASAYELWVNDVKNDKNQRQKIIQHGPKIKLQWQIFTLTSVEQMVTMENPLMNYGKKL